MKLNHSNIVESKPNQYPVFQYHAKHVSRTQVNLYFHHTKPGFTGKRVTSIKRAAFEISTKIPKFTVKAMNYTRPSTYY